MAGYSLSFEITGDQDILQRTSAKLRNPRHFMEAIGVYTMGRAVERLAANRTTDESTGALHASLAIGTGGSADTVFELGDDYVETGTNLPYAAMRQFGGIIEPKNAKALAIPLPAKLKRSGKSPRDLDPNQEILRFVPYKGSKPNIFGLLIDDEIKLTGRQRKKRGTTEYGPGPLFALAYWVRQEARPIHFFDEEDRRVINEELWAAYLDMGEVN